MEEELQEPLEEKRDAPLCGGKKKPEPKEGETGTWDCVNDVWVWIPA